MTSNSAMAGTSVAKELSADLESSQYAGRALAVAWLPLWKRLTRYSRNVLTRGVSRRLRIAETISLGEKRFISILQVDGEQFLLGGSPSNIVLLAKLEGKPDAAREATFESIYSHVGSDDRGQWTGRNDSAEVAR